MASPGICPQCGDRLPADVPHGVCPKCMLQLGFDEPNAAGTAGEQATLEPGGRFAAPQPAELATRFPQLEILDLLGQGGMGAVYRARQKTLDRIVALKVLPVEVGRDPAFTERFAREAQALARLTHPNIVMVFDFGEADGYYYFLMEYVDGVNLRQAISAGHLTAEEALGIVPQICEALQYAHDEGIVHRDIKPENVLLDKRGHVKIADFGLAKLLGRPGGKLTLTGTGQVMGTPHYMAPEQLERPTAVDHRADIYSLGVVFYELLTGELPIGRFAPPSHKTGGSTDLDQVVLRTLEKEPNHRYQQASEVKTAVQTIRSVPPQQPAVTPKVAPVSDEIRRLRVPFTISELYAGFAKATGCLWLDGESVRLEFEVKDDVLGYVSSGVKQVAIPLADVVSLEFVTGWFGLSHRIEITTYHLSTLEQVPRSEQGRARLQIARRDAPRARKFVTAGRRMLDEEDASEPLGVSPPSATVGEIAVNAAARNVRTPAVALLLVGILTCLTSVAVPILFLTLTTWKLQHRATTEMRVAREVAAEEADAETKQLARVEQELATSSVNESSNATRVFPEPAAEHASATGEGSTAVVYYNVTPRKSWLLLAAAFVTVVNIMCSIMIILGAVRLRKLESYSLCVTASVITALPIQPWFIIGLPVGLWCLATLARGDTRRAFQIREEMRRVGTARVETPGEKPPKPAVAAKNWKAQSEGRGRMSLVAILPVLALGFIATAVLGVALYFFSARSTSTPARTTPLLQPDRAVEQDVQPLEPASKAIENSPSQLR